MSELQDTKSKALQAEKDVATSGTQKEALAAAIRAAENYMKALRLANDPREKRLLDAKCKEYITRAETLKDKNMFHGTAPNTHIMAAAQQKKEPISSRTLSNREQIILLENSKLNGFVFPPWSAQPDPEEFELNEENQLFTDCTELNLSKSQQEIFDGWKRPSELFCQGTNENVLMIGENPIDLVQDVTTDCSVVASLCAGASQGMGGHSKLVSTIKIYPCERKTGRPQVSPSGKYILRLHFNGCYRKVVIDDRLPSSNSSRTLHVVDRNNPTSIWPALVEKAYLKVRGGYDFPGSNSGTDMWILTGWIPEQLFLHDDEIVSDQLWDRLYDSFHSANVLLTIGTGELTAREERVLGLVGSHDYAILDMKEENGRKRFLVKNPWAGGAGWKGLGGKSAVSALQEIEGELEPSNPKRSPLSPGTFWMDSDEILQNFENLYLNWNPCLFKARQDFHFRWDLSLATTVPGCFIDNPQFAVASKFGGDVWLLLNKHFKTAENSKNTRQLLDTEVNEHGFISLYVFDKRGQRVYLSDGAIHRSPYVDSPNTLVRLEMPSNTIYTVVFAEQSLPRSNHSFSLSGFSNSPLSITLATEKYVHVRKYQAAWTSSTAGGNAESERYPCNPQFRLKITQGCDVAVLLETENIEIATHVKIFWSRGERVSEIRSRDILCDSGDYRRGFALAESEVMKKGAYTIVCSTFEPDQLSKFTLRVASTMPCEVKPLPREGAGRLLMSTGLGIFSPGTDRILAPVTVLRLCRLKLSARRKGSWIAQKAVAPSPILMTLELGQGPYKEILAASGDGDFRDLITGVHIESVDLQPELGARGVWLVVERVGGPGGQVEDHIEVEIFSEERVEIGPWGVGDG